MQLPRILLDYCQLLLHLLLVVLAQLFHSRNHSSSCLCCFLGPLFHHLFLALTLLFESFYLLSKFLFIPLVLHFELERLLLDTFLDGLIQPSLYFLLSLNKLLVSVALHQLDFFHQVLYLIGSGGFVVPSYITILVEWLAPSLADQACYCCHLLKRLLNLFVSVVVIFVRSYDQQHQGLKRLATEDVAHVSQVLLEGGCPWGALYDKHKSIYPISTLATELNDFGGELAHHIVYLFLVESSIAETRSIDDIDAELWTRLLGRCEGTTCEVVSHCKVLTPQNKVTCGTLAISCTRQEHDIFKLCHHLQEQRIPNIPQHLKLFIIYLDIIFEVQLSLTHISEAKFQYKLNREMDVTLFTQMLRSMNSTKESISATAEYCWQNKIAGEDIIKLAEKEMLSAKKQKKLFFFYLFNQLIMYSVKNQLPLYVKLIGSKIKALVVDFAKSVDNSSQANSLNRLIQKWSTEQVFAQSFIERLKQIIVPVCKKLLQQSQQSKVEKLNLKYSKTFLMDYLAIQDFPPAKRIYQDCVAKSELEPKITHFNEEFKKLDLDNPTPEAGQRAAELLRVAEEYKASLIKLICQYQDDYKILADHCEEEMNNMNT